MSNQTISFGILSCIPKPIVITTSVRIFRAACSAVRFRASALRRSVIRSKSRLRSSSLTRLNNERGCRRSTSFQPPSTSTPFSRFIGRTRELPPPFSLSLSLSLSLPLPLSPSVSLLRFNVDNDDYDDYVDDGERMCVGAVRA